MAPSQPSSASDPEAPSRSADPAPTSDPGLRPVPREAAASQENAPRPAKTRQELRRELRQSQRAAEQARKEAEADPVVVRPMARPARAKPRHWGLLLSFLLLVLAPAAAASWYLYSRAADQYASSLGFTVRSDELTSAADLLGGLGATLGGGGSNDSDILYEFVRSQEIVRRIDAKLDLRAIWSRHHDTDPLLGFDSSGSIEDLTDYWRRMLNISYDTSSGLMEMRVLAFAPQEAQAIARAIYDESSATINALSAQAREDATRYARADLDQALERLKTAREALTTFRVQNQIVDPSADIQGQMGLLNTLQAQLATALIEFDLLGNNTSDSDPRLEQAQRRIDVIQKRIAEERQKFGATGQAQGGENYATTIAEFERLSVDREFAERSYTAALSAYDAALADAGRQSRYLASYIQPTLAEKAEYPQRALMIGIVALFGFLIWAIGSLVYYSLRDRR